MKLRVIFFLTLFFIACGDSLKVEPSNDFLETEIRRASELYENETLDTLFVDQAEFVSLRALELKDGVPLSAKEINQYFFIRYWLYKNFARGEENFVFPTENAGEEEICHISIDHFGDTLKKCLPIFINSPQALSLELPLPNENSFSEEETIEFVFNASGIDTWETSTCKIFITDDLPRLWENDWKEIPCHSPYQMPAKKLPESKDDAPSYFWGISFETKSSGGLEKMRLGGRRFSLKSRSKKTSALVPIQYESARSHEKKGELHLFKNDSLIETFYFSNDTTFLLENLDSALYRVRAKENLRTDYAEASLEFTPEKERRVLLDTLLLRDIVAPEAIPLQNKFLKSDSVRFFVAENGSGLNALRSKILLVNSFDSLSYRFIQSKFSFVSSCESSCLMRIFLEDNAGNESPPKFYRLSVVNDSILIQGPLSGGSL